MACRCGVFNSIHAQWVFFLFRTSPIRVWLRARWYRRVLSRASFPWGLGFRLCACKICIVSYTGGIHIGLSGWVNWLHVRMRWMASSFNHPRCCCRVFCDVCDIGIRVGPILYII